MIKPLIMSDLTVFSEFDEDGELLLYAVGGMSVYLTRAQVTELRDHLTTVLGEPVHGCPNPCPDGIACPMYDDAPRRHL